MTHTPEDVRALVEAVEAWFSSDNVKLTPQSIADALALQIATGAIPTLPPVRAPDP